MNTARALALAVALAAGTLAVGSPLGCGGGSGSTDVPDASAGDASVDGAPTDGDADSGICAQGQPGCACLTGGFCTKGECVKDRCVDCTRGGDACLCRLNGTCDAGLKCADGVCAKCAEGTSGCPCLSGMACNAGLKCASGTCVADTCTTGALSCSCRATEPRCDTGLYCNAGSTCETCSSDVAGCPCTAGLCTGLVCDAGTCRKPRSCADLVASGSCVANQLCNAATKDTDASCVPERCIDNYRWDAASKTCVACGLPDYRWDPTASACVKCTNAACDAEPCGTDPIAPTCSAASRGCKLDATGKVTGCGGCLAGYAPPSGGGPTAACVAVSLCGTKACATTEWCDRSGAAPACVARKCPVGQAVDSAGLCTSCGTVACTGAGTTGAIWPTTTKDDRCICETQPGYFVRAGKSIPETCDDDKDGWVRTSADDNAVRTDPALSANSRCNILRVGSVQLVDEYGVGQLIDSCASGLKVRVAPATGCPAGDAVVPIRLLEADPNDGPSERLDAYAPVLTRTDGSKGVLAPRQLNGLTKFCAPNSDGDLDGVYDLEQGQPLAPGLDDLVAGTMPRLHAFAYFAELYTSKYSDDPKSKYGILSIFESSRCDDASFPFHYDPTIDPAFGGDAYMAALGDTYWRSCARNRVPTYSSTPGPTAGPGTDFAQWSCDGTAGTCPLVPPASKDSVAPVDPAKEILRNYGLCSLGGSKPKDGKFRGLHHHSQFKCVSVVATPTKSYEVAASKFVTPSPAYTFDTCKAVGCGLGVCEVPSLAGGTGASTSPRLRCQAEVASVGKASGVGWALVNYNAAALYGGCVNEDANWQSYVCPYPQFSSSVTGDAATMAEYLTRANASYGRYSCFGDLQNFLWAPDPLPSPVDISSLYWSDPAGVTTNASVLR